MRKTNFQNVTSRSDHGFTLLEIMIVLSIMGMILTMVIPRINNRNRELKSTLRKFTVLSKDLHRRAKLTNSTYRIAFDLKNGENNSESRQSFWVERSSKPSPFKSPKNIRELSKILEENRSEEDKDKILAPGGFEMAHEVFKEAMELPSALMFASIELASAPDETFDSGVVYIHYAPQGLVEESAIHLRMQGPDTVEWTIAIHPLTGKAELISRNMKLKEITDQ